MKPIQHLSILVLLVGFCCCGIISCSENNSSHNNLDGGDGNTDMQTDNDAGADSGTGTTNDPTSLMPDTAGWIDRTANDLWIQGAWYTFGSAASTYNPANYTTRPSTALCFDGSSPVVVNEDWEGMWGAGMGFDVCAEGADGIEGTKHGIGSCPYNPNLATQLKGVRVQFGAGGFVNGAQDFRVQFSEGEGITATYAKFGTDVVDGQVIDALFENAAVHYSVRDRPEGIQIPAVQAIQFQVSANTTTEISWSFCIEDIHYIIATE